jgi:hypothetical protein
MAAKYTNWSLNIPNGSEIDEMALNLKISFFARQSEIYPDWDFVLKIYHRKFFYPGRRSKDLKHLKQF